jgi:hypothetical protein
MMILIPLKKIFGVTEMLHNELSLIYEQSD